MTHRRHHGIWQILRFQLDSHVCSADFHHNPRKHMGLHAYHGTILVHVYVRTMVLLLATMVPMVVRTESCVLVGILRRFDRSAAWCRCPGRRSAGSGGTPRRRRGSCLLTLLSPRLWSASSCGFSTLGSTAAEVPFTRSSTVASLSRMLSFVIRFHVVRTYVRTYILSCYVTTF
jgi:hypothetical protein